MAEYTLKEMVLKRTLFPRPKCHLLLADPAAIKVRPLYLEASQTPSTCLVGSHKLSCEISKAGISIQSIECFWIEHRVFGRRRMEEG